MRKWLVLIVIVGMFGWAIFNFIVKDDKSDAERTQEENEVVGLQKGNAAPDFEIETIDGDLVHLSDYRGQVVFLNFWATWCPPCRAEMPDMQKVHDDYADLDVAILGVNQIDTESKDEDVPAFLDEFDITFPILIDKGLDVGMRYRALTYPTTYVLDQQGRVYDIAVGPLNYDMMVQVIKDLQ